MSSIEEANSERHYLALTVAIFIGLAGVYVRFIDFPHASMVGNILMALAAAFALKIVFSIIK